MLLVSGVRDAARSRIMETMSLIMAAPPKVWGTRSEIWTSSHNVGGIH